MGTTAQKCCTHWDSATSVVHLTGQAIIKFKTGCLRLVVEYLKAFQNTESGCCLGVDNSSGVPRGAEQLNVLGLRCSAIAVIETNFVYAVVIYDHKFVVECVERVIACRDATVTELDTKSEAL